MPPCEGQIDIYAMWTLVYISRTNKRKELYPANQSVPNMKEYVI